MSFLTSMSKCRPIGPNQHHKLRKQHSLSESTSNLFLYQNNGSATNRTAASTDRFKYGTTFQRQFSVDHFLSFNKNLRQKCPASNGLQRSNNLTRSCARKVCGSTGAHQSVSAHQSVIESDNGVHMKFNSTVKKRAQTKNHNDNKRDKLNAERAKKSLKAGDDRYNLKIFLGQSISRKETEERENNESSEESEAEKIDSPTPLEKQLESADSSESKEPSPKPDTQPIRPQLSASTRRAQFLASSRAIQAISIVSSNSSPTVANTATLTVERRPPLVRAMSAPIRTNDENYKNTLLANKRKFRRRRISSRSNVPENSTENVVIETSFGKSSSEGTENLSDRPRNKPAKKTLERTRSTIGCDVVTLVSLISSEGSDSEKEESLVAIETIALKRPPLLRKSGKSVSFQEHELQNLTTSTKEYAHVIRRGSVAPLAARIRANRPPTAPPGSIFIRDFNASDSKMATNFDAIRKDNTAEGNSSTNSKENIPENCNASTENQFPEYVKTFKERECWKLFQKMITKGVSVSYDTILRGMLTPTELRQLQKQREVDASKKAKELEEAEASK